MFSKVKKLSQNNTATMQSKRTHSEVTESTPMTSNASKKQKTGSGPKKLYMMHEFDSTEIAVVVAKNTQQELVPKMVQKGQEDSKYPLQVNTPVVSVQYSDMKKGGDEGKFGKTSKEASYNLKVRRGLSEVPLSSDIVFIFQNIAFFVVLVVGCPNRYCLRVRCIKSSPICLFILSFFCIFSIIRYICMYRYIHIYISTLSLRDLHAANAISP